jgi:hypothetical protein
LFSHEGLITQDELEELAKPESWVIDRVQRNDRPTASTLFAKAIGVSLRLLPGRIRQAVAAEALKPHLMRSLRGKP